MKIVALSGVHGIGKTTLINELHKIYHSIIIEESATHFLQTKFPFQDVDNDIDVFKEFQRALLADQIKKLKSFFFDDDKILFVDRTPIDSLGYVFERLSKERSFDFEYYKKYREDVYEIMEMFHWNKIYFTKFDFLDKSFDWVWKRKDFGDRNPSPFYLENLNAIILQEYMRFRGLYTGTIEHFFTIHFSDVEDRKVYIASTIDEYFGKEGRNFRRGKDEY